MCLVIIKADEGASGPITVKGESVGLKGASVKVNIAN
jgi:hypothetical protein